MFNPAAAGETSAILLHPPLSLQQALQCGWKRGCQQRMPELSPAAAVFVPSATNSLTTAFHRTVIFGWASTRSAIVLLARNEPCSRAARRGRQSLAAMATERPGPRLYVFPTLALL